MPAYWALGIMGLGLPTIAHSSAAPSSYIGHSCRYIPGDGGWPSAHVWQRLNATVGGRLIATVPLGRVCHQTGSFTAFDEAKCEDLAKAFETEGPVTM